MGDPLTRAARAIATAATVRETPMRAAARSALADAIAEIGPAWRNAADSLRAGRWGNVWTEAALTALERTARQPLEEPE